ncbi:non-hydrolyzing UDP-N-acetylglucosamine 2-epimerase [Actinoplanes xinjiangensis]|uniref:UDP-N-acetylglucosamine 2-epimerase (non-hydrolyzing) n=1 Tax=Actinoplanes xinjiangensis TaxID=512350 RepID=A0A316FCA8_9ACTN|nr:UDP-N-acetylglucosamine 2-epimerase (non-hydrolyzing) [Actinoplanes xinjiangensis]PWK46528.1 UDP-N-acetylglucosamine 2-epimerase [Actinoplanes xinjiangensis]GIF40648.1 UDP-N-acetyl glucosamine 2-epimerase [Actinoplanes xinjiangensis]
MSREVHLVGGTRPEAVKLAPVALAMREAGLLTPILLASGQHPTMVTQALAAFDLKPDITLQVERETGSQAELLTAMIRELDELWSVRTPAAVIVQGDTTTSLAGALAAFWRRIPVVHLEAGLRSGDLESPFPEEGNRRLVAQVAALHLAPTPLAAMNLLDEKIPVTDVLITGNTVVDATLAVAARKLPFENADVAAARATGVNRLVLVTAHRRESWGEPLDRILSAVKELIARYDDIDVILPSHPNPAVRAQVDAALAGVERVTVTDPLPYPDLARLLSEAYLVLTDSGGIQEEAPSFGVPALVLRDVTERVESLHAGCAKLVGSDPALIVSEASLLLDSRMRRDAMTAGGNPYGDGLAAQRTAQATAALLGLASFPEAMPVAPSALKTGAVA